MPTSLLPKVVYSSFIFSYFPTYLPYFLSPSVLSPSSFLSHLFLPTSHDYSFSFQPLLPFSSSSPLLPFSNSSPLLPFSNSSPLLSLTLSPLSLAYFGFVPSSFHFLSLLSLPALYHLLLLLCTIKTYQHPHYHLLHHHHSTIIHHHLLERAFHGILACPILFF